MQTIRLTMAQALIRFLDNQYVNFDGKEFKFIEGVLGIFGHGNVTGIGEALEYESHHLKFIRGTNEQGMVHTATAFAKQHDRLKIYAVTASIGPGATNMITGAATATINRIPVLLLAGDVFANRQPDPVLQQLEHPLSHSETVNDCFRPVSRYWDRINRPEQLMLAMLKAIKVLTDPVLTGAVTICLPQDVQCESFDYPMEFFKKRVHTITQVAASSQSLEEAAYLIKKSKRPLIIAGGGVHYAKAMSELAYFASVHAIPVAETQAGKSAITYDHPMHLGGIGVIGTSCANRLAQKSDLILAIGTRLTDFVTCSKGGFLNKDVKIININVDPFDVDKLEPICKLQADAKVTLTALHQRLALSNYQTPTFYQEEIKQEQTAWYEERAQIIACKEPNNGIFNQTQVIGFLNELLSPQSVVVCAAGSLPGDLQRLWLVSSKKGYHLEYGYSCMGYEVAGGLGVKLAEPEREVWVMVGDGSFLMMHSEIVTAIQERIKINIILFDSTGFNSIKSLQCAHGSQGFGTDLRFRNLETDKLDGKPLSIDFALYAKALGVETYKVTNFSQLRRALSQASQSTQSTLIEVKVAAGSQSKAYDSWWRVGVSNVSPQQSVLNAHAAMADLTRCAKLY